MTLAIPIPDLISYQRVSDDLTSTSTNVDIPDTHAGNDDLLVFTLGFRESSSDLPSTGTTCRRRKHNQRLPSY
jgi:hypothetical protein